MQEGGRAQEGRRIEEGRRAQEGRRVYFGGPVSEPSPNYTIFREGGQGFTKYTVYAKQSQGQGAAREQRGELNGKVPGKGQGVLTELRINVGPMEVQGRVNTRLLGC